MARPTRTIGRPGDVLVIGGGPLGVSTARALAISLSGTSRSIHLVDANIAINGDFTGLSMSCPHAAGQIIVHSFEEGSLAKRLGRDTLHSIRDLTRAGVLHAEARPWLVCAGNGKTPVDMIAAEILDAALRDGRLEGCGRIHGDALGEITGLRADRVAFAVCDPDALGLDPRRFIVDLTQWALAEPAIQGHFGYRVTEFDGCHFVAEDGNEVLQIHADAAVLCTGVHRELFPEALPPSYPIHLHVFDHRSADHMPVMRHSVVGATTIARYEGFGPGRMRLMPYLSEIARSLDIHALLTDVPGLRRMLDTHIVDGTEAEARMGESLDAIGDELEKLLDTRILLGRPQSVLAITGSTIARYVKCPRERDDPVLEFLDAPLPALYVQPSDGRGLCQSIALGELAAKTLLAAIA